MLTSSFTRKVSQQCLLGTSWSPEKEQHPLPDPDTIIKEDEIYKAIVESNRYASDPHYIKDVLQKAKDKACMKDTVAVQDEFMLGLEIEEAAALLNAPESLADDIYDTAFFIKNRIYGNRVVLFAPLYLSNHCVCSCTYCGYRCENKTIPRNKLSLDQMKEEVVSLQKMGHKRLLLLTGESPEFTFEQFMESLKVASAIKTDVSGEIRRINVEIPPLSISDCRRLKETKVVGTYTVFQETYNREMYRKYHPYGPKADYDYRLTTMDRAQIAGLDDVGIGALFGLYDYRFEVLALLQHSKHLDLKYGSGPHTISVPRIRSAFNTPMSERPEFEVNDQQFKRLVSVLRCAVPYTGMILSTRESEKMRDEVLKLGASQLSAGSNTEVGRYSKNSKEKKKMGQFSVVDERSTEEVVYGLLKDGYVPSWCTACYRVGRTGQAFMKWAKRGEIHNLCQPNSLQTLAEYLLDYGSDRVKELGWNVINRELKLINDPIRRKITEDRLEKIKNGARDLYF